MRFWETKDFPLFNKICIVVVCCLVLWASAKLVMERTSFVSVSVGLILVVLAGAIMWWTTNWKSLTRGEIDSMPFTDAPTYSPKAFIQKFGIGTGQSLKGLIIDQPAQKIHFSGCHWPSTFWTIRPERWHSCSFKDVERIERAWLSDSERSAREDMTVKIVTASGKALVVTKRDTRDELRAAFPGMAPDERSWWEI